MECCQRPFMEICNWKKSSSESEGWQLSFWNAYQLGRVGEGGRSCGQKGMEHGIQEFKDPTQASHWVGPVPVSPCVGIQVHTSPASCLFTSFPRTQRELLGTLNIFPRIFIGWLSPWLLKRHKWSFLLERGSLFTVIRCLKTLFSHLCWTNTQQSQNERRPPCFLLSHHCLRLPILFIFSP